MHRGWRILFTHSVFVSVCAGALCVQSFLLTNLPIHWPLCFSVSAFTLGGYNLYWLISKQHFSARSIQQVLRAEWLHGLLFFAGTLTGIGLALPYQASYIWFLITALLGGMYTIPLFRYTSKLTLRVPGSVKTILLGLVWTVATVMVPLPGEVSTSSLWFLCVMRFAFILMLNIIFDVGDAANDKALQVRSLATDVQPKAIHLWMGAACIVYFLTVFFWMWLSLPYLLGLALWVWLWPIVVLYRKAFYRQSYWFYYVYTDGLMLCAAVATYLAGIAYF